MDHSHSLIVEKLLLLHPDFKMDLSVTMLRLSPKADAKEEEKPEETPFFGNLIFHYYISHFLHFSVPSTTVS